MRRLLARICALRRTSRCTVDRVEIPHLLHSYCRVDELSGIGSKHQKSSFLLSKSFLVTMESVPNHGLLVQANVAVLIDFDFECVYLLLPVVV